MSKMPDEIKKGLWHCSEEGCKKCPYEDDCNMADGFSVLAADALAYIQQIEADNAQLNRCIENMTDKLNAANDEVAKLQAERDAAVDGLKKAANEKGECFECKWYNGKNCTHQDYKTICSSRDDKWEWRGVQKEE